MLSTFKKGFGKFIEAQNVSKHNPGDIRSGLGYVYICIEKCTDGSVVFVHSIPCGMQINWATIRDGSKDSSVIKLAKKYMKNYYEDWYKNTLNSEKVRLIYWTLIKCNGMLTTKREMC